jgi:Na+-driven multidrug efflux pump
MLKQIFASQLRLNVFVGIATTAVNLVVLAVAYPAYLYFLGYETYGVWLILATILGLAQLSNLGINSAIMKLVAEEYGRANTNGIQNYLTTVLGFTFGLAVLWRGNVWPAVAAHTLLNLCIEPGLLEKALTNGFSA